MSDNNISTVGLLKITRYFDLTDIGHEFKTSTPVEFEFAIEDWSQRFLSGSCL